MQKSFFSLLLASALLLGSVAQAAESHSSHAWALGVASTNLVANTESLSALLANGRNWIELNLGIDHTRGALQFGAGGTYKFTVAGGSETGFHVGPSLSFGTVDLAGSEKFAFAVAGLVGGHFTVADHLLFSVDGGPILTVTDGNVNFRLHPRGAILGAGVYYLF